MSNAWMVRAGRDGMFIDRFLDEGVVWLGIAKGMAAVPVDIDKAQLVKRIRAADPARSEGSAQTGASMAVRFFKTIKVGDRVVTYNPTVRMYYLGQISGGISPTIEWEDDILYARPVTWTHRVLRDRLSQAAKNSLGSISTLFEVKGGVLAELEKNAVPIDAPESIVSQPQRPPAPEADGATDARAIYDEVIAKAEDFVADMIAALDPDQMEVLVAGLLRAMGYRSRVSPKGADRGVDVFASPDGLGLEEPRIFVEVKHRLGTKMGSQEVRTFMGGRQQGDRCLFVSTGGFAKEARYEAERSSVPLTLIDMPALRALLIERYDALDEATRRLVPLTRVYWPTPRDA